MPSSLRRKVLVFAAGGGLALGVSLSLAGAAMAQSGGPYSSPSQDCPWYAADWNTPQDTVYPGCHDAQLTIESGGTTDGNPNNGWNDSKTPGGNGARNTTWVQWGNDQSPNDPQSKGTNTELSVPYPGQSDFYHAGCLSVNTDGTNGGPVPEQPSTQGRTPPGKGKNKGDTAPVSPAKAGSQTKYGCGNNTKGAGFALNYDVYNLYGGYGYCTIGSHLDSAVGGNKCGKMANGQSDASPTTFTPDTGTQQNLTEIMTQGLLVYYGMDDNYDNGEHDGEGPFSTSPLTDGAINGPSDGGAVILGFTPQHATNTPTPTHPEGLINASLGFCADGNCLNATTQQDTVYYGCNANTGEKRTDDRCTNPNNNSRDAANYSGKSFSPYNCSSGGSQNDTPGQAQPDSPQACNSGSYQGGLQGWRQQEAKKVNAEPGIQFYQDPDPENSPATPLNPNPAFYVGTCGIIVGGGGTNSAGDPTGMIGNHSFALPANTPVTNSAGQLFIDPFGC